jgi:hypothetical protein
MPGWKYEQDLSSIVLFDLPLNENGDEAASVEFQMGYHSVDLQSQLKEDSFVSKRTYS